MSTLSLNILMEITSHFVRLATWKEALLGGDQTHDGLDDCRDLKDIVAKISQAENVDMARVIDTSEDKAIIVCKIYYIFQPFFVRIGKKAGRLYVI